MKTSDNQPQPVTRKEKRVAVEYVTDQITRAEVNAKLKLRRGSLSGLHKVARAMRQLAMENPQLAETLNDLDL
jgi:exopolyphosphatase/pppGpp-phosphohydrolase